jgi:hypothetical protein
MPPSSLDEVSSIATHVQKCLEGFHNACDGFTKADASIRSKVPPGTIHDALGRFRLWVGNIGAHRRGRASLDYKLREASHIRDRVIELLQNLETVLQEALEIISGDRVSWEDLSDSDSDSDSTENESQRSEEELSTELGQLTSNMAEINSCLMRLSLAIRNPAPHDQFKESSQIEVAHFEPFDVDHVRDKFPKAAEYLILRLGKAISRRRQYLRYREDHRRKLDQGLAPQPVSQEPTAPRQVTNTVIAPSEKIDSTVASSIPLAFKHSTPASTLDELDDYEDTLSQTSYASSNQDLTRLRPPPLPEEDQDGEPFECPLCFRFTSVRQVPAWHKHVYRDLQPYICTFEDCEIPDRTYESRHKWFQHELQAHRRWWQCIEGCNATFHSLHEFHEHLHCEHAKLADNERITDMIRSCERQDSMDIEAECQLCQVKLSSLTLLRRHLGKHHEELSLFALPSHMKEDDDEEVENADVELDSASSVAGSDRSLRISSLDKSNPRIVQAKKLLQAKPSVVQAMDSQILDTTLLDTQLRQSMPGDVNTWAELEQWLNTSRRTNIFAADLEHIRVLQAVQFQTIVLTQEIDEYFERLTSFHKDRGSGDIEDLMFFVDERLHSIYELVRAIITHGGFHKLKQLRDWIEIGKDLGNGKELTQSGLHKLNTAYEHYLLPFETFQELGEEGSPEGVSRVNLTIQSGSLDSDLGADVVLRAVPVSTTADGLLGRILLTKPSIAAPGRVRLTYAGREMKNLETIREILPSELRSENYVFHINYESVDQGYGVTSGSTTSSGTPAPPVDLDDGGYSYTDPASMYRDTEPAWRRPRAGSLERGSRPTSMIMDRAPRSSTRELGPPPSVRGFDKINNSIVPTSHMVSLPGLVMLMTTDASGTVPSPGKLELSENFWLYVSRDPSLRFNISFDSVVAFGIFRPKQIRLETLRKEFYTNTDPVIEGDMFFSFTDTGDFIAAYEHIRRRIPDKLRKFEMSADDSRAVQDLITDYDAPTANLTIHEVHDIEIETSAEMGSMLASMLCTPTNFVLIDQGSEEQWGFSCEDLTSYNIENSSVDFIAAAAKRLSNRGRAFKHFFVGDSKIRMTPRNPEDVQRIANLMSDYIDKGRATRLREKTSDNDLEPLNVEPKLSHDLSIDRESIYFVDVRTVHTDNQKITVSDLEAATLSLHNEIVFIEYLPTKTFADGRSIVNLSNDGQYYMTESAIWLFGVGYQGLVNICITPQALGQMTEIAALVEKALGTEWRLEELADVLKKDLSPTQTKDDDGSSTPSTPEHPSSTATVQGIETIPMFPGLDITSTKANIDGVPFFDREKLALVQISSAELSFRDDGAPEKDFCIRSEGLENVWLQGRSVYVTGWLQCLGNSTKPKVPGVLSGCKNFTMTFDSEEMAKSIFTMLRLVLKSNLRGYEDQELNPQEQRSQKPGVAVGDEVQTSSQPSYEHEPSKQQDNLPSGDREFTHTSGPDVPSTGNDGVSSEETIPELEKSQEKSGAHDFAFRPREAESTSTPLPQIIKKESREEMEDNARVQGMSSKMSDVSQEEKEAPKFELSGLVDFAERNFIK